MRAVIHPGSMSRLPASALEEGDLIDAILRPLLSEVGAAERRHAILAKAPAPRPWALAELDQTIDLLLTRMRVDPRLRTREATRPGTREAARPGTRDAIRPITSENAPLPPPVPSDLRTAETRKAALVGPPPVPGSNKTPISPPVLPAMADRAARPTRPADWGPGTTIEPRSLVDGKRLDSELPPPADELDRAAWPRQGYADDQQAPPLPLQAVQIPALPNDKPKRVPTTVYSLDEVQGAIVPAVAGNAPETFLLFDDIVMLSGMNDRDGLLISLERLLVMAKLEDHIKAFIDSNEVKLIGLYESQLKSFARIPKRAPAAVHNTMPRVFLRGEKVAAVLDLVDEKTSINDIIKRAAPLTPIETCSVLAQLQRSGVLEI